jgi:hypothetical protein
MMKNYYAARRQALIALLLAWIFYVLLGFIVAPIPAYGADVPVPTDRELNLRKQNIELVLENIQLQIPKLREEYQQIVAEIEWRRKKIEEQKAQPEKKTEKK